MYAPGMGRLGQGATNTREQAGMTPSPQLTSPSWSERLTNFAASAFDSGITAFSQAKQAKDLATINANADAAARVAIARAQISSQAATRFKVTPMMIGVGVGALALVALIAMRRR